MWAYRDPSRVGYDSIGADYYLEKPWGFDRGGDSQSAYYEAEIPDCTKEEAEAMGHQAPLCFYLINSPLNSFTFNPCASWGPICPGL